MQTSTLRSEAFTGHSPQ